MLVLFIHEIITPENYKFFKGVVPMDKITHQVRAEHWAKIMNECINSGMSKTAWCRANGISAKQFFYWQRILRREAYGNYQNSSLPAMSNRIMSWRQRVKGRSLLLRSSFHLLLRAPLLFSVRIS